MIAFRDRESGLTSRTPEMLLTLNHRPGEWPREQPRKRGVDLMGFHNPKRQRGIEFAVFSNNDPSLTQRVMIKSTSPKRLSGFESSKESMIRI
jgi:hypothetical protein